MENEGHGDVARLAILVEQEVGVQMYFAVVLDVKPRRLLEVGQIIGVGQGEIENFPDPASLLF